MNRARSLARRPSQTRSLARSQGPSFSSDNPLPAFLAFLAEDTKVGERTARQYVAHLQRLSVWLEQHYQAALLEATTHDLRQYKTELGQRQKPASVNAALAALRRFFSWAAETERIIRNPALHLTDVAAQPLAPKGFSDVERRRLVRQAEKDGPMAEAIVMLLLNTGLRVDELVTLTWQRIQLHPRSGSIDVIGKGDKRRRLPLNVEARKALEAIQPTPPDDNATAVFRGERGRTRRAGSNTWLASSADAHKSRMCIRIASATTQPGAWSSRSTCPPLRRGWVMSGWTPSGFTVSRTKLRSSGPPLCWSDADTESGSRRWPD